jgi:hypothetical protein
MRTLRITHPMMHGPDVRALQTALHKNPYGDFYVFKVDGGYGPTTAHRVAAAKWHLGYATFEPVAGLQFMRYITGARPLPAAYQKRRDARQRAPKATPHPESTMGVAALKWALTKVGQHEEPPGSNHCFATVEWGHGNMAWCDVFVSLAYIHAGSSAFSKSAQKWQFVPSMLQAARAGNQGLHCIPFKDLKPGDIIVHGPGAYHTTLHDRIVSVGSRLEWDVGGNEGWGGTVYHDLHDASLADAFIRVER